LLADVRVLDFGRYIAGPYCAALLADLGAEVIRVEKTGGSEDRYLTPVADGAGALFLQVNRNKLGMTLDPRTAQGAEIVRKLVATADVVVANLPPQTLVQMGLDYPSLCQSKPDIILATVSAFGPGGPYSEKVGFDGIGQAMSGVMFMSGEPGQPTRAYAPWVDFATAMSSAFGTLAALMARAQSGQGQVVEGALLHSALTIGNATLIEQAVIEANRVATLNRSQTSAPSDVYRTGDGWIVVQVIGQPLFERWARLMGEDHWLADPRFADDEARGIHGEEVSRRMAAWCAELTVEEALGRLEAARIPAGPVYAPQQALDDPHVRASGFLKAMDYPGAARPAPVSDTPVRLSATPTGVRHRAPVLGEHTDRILSELGYDAAAIAELRAAGVI
jgi:crotonobetainyl-CoA:carnitine CoA-transferase CaiB-like acyl-CoA transferase